MLSDVSKWLESPENIFLKNGVVFDVSTPPKEASASSMTLDFEMGKYLCRLIFWEEGFGHFEAIEIETGESFKNDRFDADQELSSDIPFESLMNELKS